ncbi:HNHc domain-containing protein [Fusarium falciforme]|uniref:HNHc domain-containing protein n=1 Tax=Fusarium falciforme TaxID=195108 RepID=UPI0022FFCC1A|nr:HNHc domain-containing protein [Fusarium falciforme]WAO97314.1 HNHc domain-containing protein [Fusarium falciforme]
MSSTAVTPTGRTLGWNIHFLVGRGRGHFAGLFRPSDSDLVRFRDVVDELRLCFEFPGSTPHRVSSCPAFFWEEGLHLPVLSLSTPDIRRPNVLSFRIVRHVPCNLPSNSSLNRHLETKCGQHIPQPVRRHEPRSLLPEKPSADPRHAIMPLRKTLKGKSRSAPPPPKHTVSGSVSPTRDGSADADEEDITGMVAPPTMTLALDYAKSTVTKFRSSCLQASNVCAVSGKGQSCSTTTFTPIMKSRMMHA